MHKYVILVFLTLPIFAHCSDNKRIVEPEVNPLIGQWEEEYTIEIGGISPRFPGERFFVDLISRLRFTADSLTITVSGKQNYSGTYSVDNDSMFSLPYPADSNLRIYYDYRITENVLHLIELGAKGKNDSVYASFLEPFAWRDQDIRFYLTLKYSGDFIRIE